VNSDSQAAGAGGNVISSESSLVLLVEPSLGGER
jgi:hypothetical protein